MSPVESMRAIVIRQPGEADVLAMREVARPDPADGELLVRVAASGVNRADLLQRRGRYPAPPGYPEDIPGLEYAGTVEALGNGVRRFKAGDAVMGITGGGGYAEFVVVSEAAVVAAPTEMDLVQAGAVPEVFMTAFDAVFLQEGLKRGEVLLIHAVGSGVGTAALQLAVRAGAYVIGTSRTADKLEQAAGLGLEHSVLAGDDWPEQVLQRSEGRGADVILDLVGGPYLAGNQRVLAGGGRHIVVGVPGGPAAEIDLRALMRSRGSIRGTVLRARPVKAKATLARAFEADVLPGFASGELRPVVDSVFPAAEAADAHRRMEANQNFGKIILEW